MKSTESRKYKVHDGEGLERKRHSTEFWVGVSLVDKPSRTIHSVKMETYWAVSKEIIETNQKSYHIFICPAQHICFPYNCNQIILCSLFCLLYHTEILSKVLLGYGARISLQMLVWLPQLASFAQLGMLAALRLHNIKSLTLNTGPPNVFFGVGNSYTKSFRDLYVCIIKMHIYYDYNI